MGAVLATPLRANGMFIAFSAPKVPFAQKREGHETVGGSTNGGWRYKNTLPDPGRVFSYCGA
ncbi:hypothetical protein RE2895_00120 [Rhodococcus erythropolis]|nr:hypothetical protein RE2895_00120 [Rhodococcus erythropolis]